MARWLKQSTSVDVPIGPFLDATDGVTAETGLTITQADIRLKKNAAAWAQKAAAQTLSHEENGYYEVTLDATDTNTVGLLRLAVAESGALPIWEDFLVLPANVYDSLVAGSDTLNADVTQWTGTNVTTPDTAGSPKVTVTSGTGTGQISLSSGAVLLQATQTGVTIPTVTTVGSVTGAVGSVTGAVGSVTGNVGGNVVGSAASVVGAVGSVTGNVGGNVVGSVASVTGAVASVTGAVGSVTGNVGGNVVGSVGSVTTVSDKTGYRLSATGVDDVWDEAMAGHTTAGTYGDKLRAHAAGVLKALMTSGSTTTAVVLNATTGIEGGVPSATNDFYNGRVIIFITGTLAGQATDITDYVGSTKTLTVTALTSAPSSGDTAVIV
jgi:hypothetical protein